MTDMPERPVHEPDNTRDKHVGIYKRLLMEFTDWDGTLEVKPNANIKHGPCCVCSDCGHWHDECVCDHNYIVNQILATIEAEEETYSIGGK